MYGGNKIIGGWPHFEFFGQTGILWCHRQFCLSYSTSPRFFTLESIISKSFLIGKYFVMNRFTYHSNDAKNTDSREKMRFFTKIESFRQKFEFSAKNLNFPPKIWIFRQIFENSAKILDNFANFRIFRQKFAQNLHM